MKRLFLLVAVLLLAPGSALLARAQNAGQPAPAAQGRVSGAVADAETGEPIASATVGVWRSRDSTLVTGAVSQPDGRFAVEGLRDGRYYVSVSFVGFATQTLPDVALSAGDRQIDLGTIALAPDTQVLDEVQVSA
ncbi:MAG: carboxypeptidase-like regulatory domain-containing protein, partial [Rhodothermales bacterium]|nr:carboxypeptidase-like regulatory domain-containing protein [Rhodothermales bacterium]